MLLYRGIYVLHAVVLTLASKKVITLLLVTDDVAIAS